MSVSLVAVTLIKNEADIILASLNNLYGLGINMFAIMDNNSSDKTMEKIHQFRCLHDNANVLIVQDFEKSHFQSKKVTALAKMAADYFSATHVYPFDADEFLRPVGIAASGGVNLLAETDDAAVSLRWRTCLPGAEGELYMCKPYSSFNKILVRWGPDVTINEGNHSASYECTNWRGRAKRKSFSTKVLNGYEVLHVPVRNAEQLRTKILNGAAANSIHRNTNSGMHWTTLHHLYLRNGETFFQEFFNMLQRGVESELAAFCLVQRVNREHLCYFNDYFLPRTCTELDLGI
jgi:hypothetical protein